MDLIPLLLRRPLAAPSSAASWQRPSPPFRPRPLPLTAISSCHIRDGNYCFQILLCMLVFISLLTEDTCSAMALLSLLRWDGIVGTIMAATSMKTLSTKLKIYIQNRCNTCVK
ncbi:hypothetical protein V2J09_006334 [Rumex salicifolius]